MKWVNKHYIGITTGISFVLILLSAVKRNELTPLQISTATLCLLLALHLWEENRFPGGFHEMTLDRLQISRATLEVAGVFQLLIIGGYAILAFLFPGTAWLSLILATLGILEGIVHTAMIKIFRQKKPYSPGMITAYIMLILSVWEFYYAIANHLVDIFCGIAAVFIMVVSFILGQRWMLKHAGLKIRDMKSRMLKFMKTGSPV